MADPFAFGIGHGAFEKQWARHPAVEAWARHAGHLATIGRRDLRVYFSTLGVTSCPFSGCGVATARSSWALDRFFQAVSPLPVG